MVKVTGAAQIPCPTSPAIVPAAVNGAAGTADRNFFPRRTRVRRRPSGSPNIPCTRHCGRNPGNVYVSASRRRLRAFGIHTSCQIFRSAQHVWNPVKPGAASTSAPRNRPHEFTMTHIKFHCLILSSSVSTQFQARGITDPLRGT